MLTISWSLNPSIASLHCVHTITWIACTHITYIYIYAHSWMRDECTLIISLTDCMSLYVHTMTSAHYYHTLVTNSMWCYKKQRRRSESYAVNTREEWTLRLRWLSTSTLNFAKTLLYYTMLCYSYAMLCNANTNCISKSTVFLLTYCVQDYRILLVYIVAFGMLTALRQSLLCTVLLMLCAKDTSCWYAYIDTCSVCDYSSWHLYILLCTYINNRQCHQLSAQRHWRSTPVKYTALLLLREASTCIG
jgi:hypothetical protein